MQTTQGEIIAEGKTKIVRRLNDRLVSITSKPDITAGDGAKKDSFLKKDVFATTTTSRVFELLRACGIPVAYEKQANATEFIAQETAMIPLEVVARRVIGEKSSYRKRHPYIEAGTVLPTLVVEFFLKTTNKTYREYTFDKDDPLIEAYSPAGITVRRPDIPTWIEMGNPIMQVPLFTSREERLAFPAIEELTRKTFLVLEGAWNALGMQLSDLKIEVGYTKTGQLVVSDVIDADSWRLLDENGDSLDKQSYRDGAALVKVASIYERVAALVERFSEMHAKPTIVLWCASEQDDRTPFLDELARLGHPANLHYACGSVHKKPEQSLQSMRSLLLERPSSTVVIACVGRSNGAGPVFACDTHIPVIACPPGLDKFPENIWSSVNLPSDCPLLFQASPANAVQAALGILSARSPHAYLARRYIVELAHRNAKNSPSFGK